jgi:conserved oligomeric Golgi complex subunit 6
MPSFSPSHSRSGSPAPVLAARNGSWAAQTRNPVSLRLYKVLGSNFEDDATTEALRTLSELYVTLGPSKAEDHAQLDLDDGHVPDSDEERAANSHVEFVLSETVPGESAARARKNLRRDMETKLAEGSRQFLKAFGEVDDVGSFVKQAFTLLELTLATGRNWMNYSGILMTCGVVVMRRRLSSF